MATLTKEQIDKLNQSKQQPATQQAKTPRQKPSKALAITNGHQKLASSLQQSQAVLDELETGMDGFSEDFSDRVAEIVEDGMVAAWEKTAQKVAAIEVPDFFGVVDRSSLFGLKPRRLNPALPPVDITVDVLPAEVSV